MSGLFGTFNIAVKGLNANQTALHTTSHNISNANTEGFSRQRVELKTDNPYNMAGVGQLGTGVRLQSVVRMVDEFVDYQIRKENSVLENYTAQSDVLGQIEMIFNEPSNTGLNFAMSEMFNAWQELSKNPESANAQSIVAEKSKTFADSLNHMAIQAKELKGDVESNVEKSIFDVNSLISQLDTVNEQIFNITVKGQSPNDLLDSRDLLLKKITGLTGAKESIDLMGRGSIELGGENLSGANAPKLSSITEITEKDGIYTAKIHVGGDAFNEKSIILSSEDLGKFKVGSPVLYNENPDAGKSNLTSIQMTSGTIAGYLTAGAEIDQRIGELDQFAKGTANMVNTIHEGENGISFFTFKGEESAENFMVNSVILSDEDNVATGKGKDSAPGDGSRALAIAHLRTTKVDFGNLSAQADLQTNTNYNANTMKFDYTSGNTMEGAYGDIVIKVGIRTEHAKNMVENQGSVLAQLNNRRESVSGVSIDEEVTNLLKYQRSYEANSRVINTLNEMLDTLINRTGV